MCKEVGAAQMVSSITGKVFDSWTLTKPAGFKADVAGRTAFVKLWVPQYVPDAPYPKGGTSLETQGAYFPEFHIQDAINKVCTGLQRRW